MPNSIKELKKIYKKFNEILMMVQEIKEKNTIKIAL